jgi:TPR repeat protein
LEKVAAQNVDNLSKSRAAADLGELYFEGKLVPADYSLALKWFGAVDESYMEHCHSPLSWVRGRLIQIYTEGLGVEKNPERVDYYMRFARFNC